MILIGYVLVIIVCGQVVNALDCQSKDHRFKPHQLPQEKKQEHLSFSTWYPTQAQVK